jgi:isopenicillin N synthase-like dioxygenase
MTVLLRKSASEQLAENGFLLASVSEEVRRSIDITFRCAKDFFSRSGTEKLESKLPYDCGYRPPGVEYSSSSDTPDAIESFTASIRTREKGRKLKSVRAFRLHERMIGVFKLLEPLAEILSVELARTVSGDDWSASMRGAFHRRSRLQINYALPTQSKLEFINELHEDGHLLTIACSTAPGLEVLLQEQTFACPYGMPGDVTVMPGNIAWLLSGGHVRPLHHRVRRMEDQRERMSLLFFADVDPSRCEPWIRNSVNAQVDIGACVLANNARFGISDFPLE